MSPERCVKETVDRSDKPTDSPTTISQASHVEENAWRIGHRLKEVL